MDQKFFKVPFATNGDQTAIPDAVDPAGFVSFDAGYGFDYERDRATDPAAKAIERDKMNYLFGAITEALSALQTSGVPEWITSADNGGAPYAYDKGAMAKYRALVSDPWLTYISAATGNTQTPGVGADWIKLAPETLAKFTSTLAYASTAFVRQEIGSMSGYMDISVSTAFTGAAHVGKMLRLTGAGLTHTLPAANSVPAGAKLMLANGGSAAIIQRAGTDSIDTVQSTATSVTLGQNDNAIFVSNGINAWTIAGGTLALAYSNGLFALSNFNPGYAKFPNGLVVQWGSGSAAGTSIAVTFPFAFVSNCRFAHAIDIESVAASIRYAGLSADPTTTGATFTWNSAPGGFLWFAFGI